MSRKGNPASSVVRLRKNPHWRKNQQKQEERWAKRASEVTVTKVERCPQCLSWNFPSHSCRT